MTETAANTTSSTVDSCNTGLLTCDMLDNYGVTLSVMSSVICSIGIISNLIVIRVFVRQGITDTVTMTFLALAVSDLGAVITMFGVGLCFSPLVIKVAPNVNLSSLSYIVGWFHNMFARISSGFTVFISLERCLCIAMPLKVKTIITKRRTLVVLVIITILIGASVAPVFVATWMGWVTQQGTNKTVLGLVFADNREFVSSISVGLNTVFLIPGTLVLMISFTIVLIVQLSQKAKWRDSVSNVGKTASTSSPNNESVVSTKAKWRSYVFSVAKRTSSDSNTVTSPKARWRNFNGNGVNRPANIANNGTGLSKKDKRAVKMVLLISIFAIICFTPNCINSLAAILVPEFKVGKKEENFLFMSGTFCLFLQAVSCSVNLFIYVTMSSKFRDTLLDLCIPRR